MDTRYKTIMNIYQTLYNKGVGTNELIEIKD